MKMVALGTFLVQMMAFAYSAEGLIAYKKLCADCHGPAFKGAAMMNSDEWSELFADDAKKLKKIHADNKKALENLETTYFKRRGEYLRHFLMNNARDMGVVRSCDGLNCG